MSTEARFAQAKAFHLAGAFAAARPLYEAILADEPANDDVMFRLGILAWQTGDGEMALAWVRGALERRPREARYRLGEGQVLVALQRLDEAAAAYRQVLADDARSCDAWFALGCALQAKGDWPAAIDAYSSLLAIEPAHADALNNLGNCLYRCGEAQAAEAAYRRALAVQPAYASALANLATLLQARGAVDEAVTLLHEAIRAEPHTATHHANLGTALAERRHYAEAAEALERALALDACCPQAAYNLGAVREAQGRYPEAAAHYEAAVALNPGHADAYNNLGNVRKALGEFAAAAQAFDAALRLRPGFVAARNNAGNLARTLGRMDEAEAHYRAALDGDASSATHRSATYNNLGNVLKDTGELDEAVQCYRDALQCDPGNIVSHSNLAYALTFQTEDAGAILAECRRLAERHEAPFAGSARVYANTREPDRRLRIGYVSADFRDHCQSLFTVPLLSHHDRTRHEIVCYSSVARPDGLTQRIQGYADLWRDVREFDDDALAQAIRDDAIDVLVDLTMHMADGRPLLYARRPAPVQVAWLAYPGTTGSQAIGYRLTDPWLDPLGQADVDACYSERSIRLPDAFWCYDPLADVHAVGAPPAVRNGYLTFGCLNNACKLTDRTLRMWAPVFARLPSARLMLMAAPGAARDRLSARLRAHGIDDARVDFVAFRPRAAYLQTYHAIDVALDTLPYNGHTTSLDALWMGVPVVTRVGPTVVGRGGLSQLANLGLTDLVAHTDDDFVRLAVELAGDLPRLAALRAGLRARMQASPLMDGARFARNIEHAYREMWRAWCGQGV
ncbi:tetratricopeptide repeat protein [Trinickia fusca]|uniref:protein O-GlcNAc transferase n=1 Tax=Trinickia fusca TaxID=2419777 RepID=A0A494X753_9BURK|nr:tetratricopeptide repeat protein [Trinickia fusca]RKP44116.1 tetratricopeptide repeat protein [Trinickia fusca]